MRIKLSEKYQNEREDICKKLISIIELDENKSFLLCDLDNDMIGKNALCVFKFRLSPLQIIKRKRKKLDHRR